MTDIGDWLTPTLTVSPFDGTTSAALVITAPDGTTAAGTGEASTDGGATWTANAVQLTAAGMWVFAWTVTGTGKGVEYSTVVVSLAPNAVAFQPPLANLSDLLLRVGSLTDAQVARAQAALADASSLIRKYTRHDFVAVTGEVYTGRPVGTKLRLPKTPVTGVTSVTAIGWAGLPDIVLPAVGGWGWDGLDIVTIYPMNGDVWVSLPETWNDGEGSNTYRVVYDHGDATAPDEVVGICCGMVLRTLLSPTMIEGMTSERIGQYSYQLGQFQGGGSSGAGVRLTEADKDALADAGFRPRKRSTTTQLAF